MDPQHWAKIESLYHAALAKDLGERSVYLAEACAQDPELRAEVDSLLGCADAELVSPVADRDRLPAGFSLGAYEILAPLGAGGMGEVYRARDTKLKRDVALKVLPDAYARDPERMARFQREAEVLASLNHPNIAHIYGVEERALVMELVEGESPKGPMLFDDAWKIAMQIADALEYAHERGVIHRDLKPANVKVTPDGVVKLLDFGLAKAFSQTPDLAASDPEKSPTMTLGATVAGTVLGTAAYMAPEQAKGKRVDKRADIWSWGVVLYELLTGERLFKGDDPAETLAQVLAKEPGLEGVPARVRKLLRRCLEKDRKQRLRDIGDARDLLEQPAVVAAGAPPRSRLSTKSVATVAALAVIAAVVGLEWWRATRPVEHPMIRIGSDIGFGAGPFDPEIRLAAGQPGTVFALSSDGARMAAGVLDHDDRIRLAIRRLDQSEFVPIPGTENLSSPFFSPEGQRVAFFADGKLKTVPVQGGAPTILCPSGVVPSGSWGEDGYIIAALNGSGVLSRIPSGGGAPIPVTDLKNGEIAHRYPRVLPGARAVLFTAYHGNFSDDDATLEVLSIRTHERKILAHGGKAGHYIAISKGAGYVLYLQKTTLLAAPFALDSLSFTGTPQPLLNDVGQTGVFVRGLDVSNSGTLVYMSGGDAPPRSIFWLDSASSIQPLHSEPGFYNSLRFSPDRKQLAFSSGDPYGQDGVWVEDLDRDTPVPLSSLPGTNLVWTPDSKYVVFGSPSQANPGVYWTRADGSGEPQRLTDSAARPSSFSPRDKRLALFDIGPGFSADIWTAPFEGDADGPRLAKPDRFLHTPSGPAGRPTFALPAFSPDGLWIAYCSNETGVSQVYVHRYPSGAKQPISKNGGCYPIWSSNRRELFFIDRDRRINVVSYTTKDGSFLPDKPRLWAQQQILLDTTGGPFLPYDLAPDGKRFAVLLYPNKTAEQPNSPHLTFLLNFVDELRRRAPVGK
jgi:serine/threonine-protein kinase